MFDFSEKDSCGVGFIASRNIPPTHGMTLKVLECLANLDHRGAKFADGTGDGAGVLTEIPFELIRAELKELSIDLDEKTKIAHALDDLGVDYIEGGWPGANPSDTEFFQKGLDLKNSKIGRAHV